MLEYTVEELKIKYPDIVKRHFYVYSKLVNSKSICFKNGKVISYWSYTDFYLINSNVQNNYLLYCCFYLKDEPFVLDIENRIITF